MAVALGSRESDAIGGAVPHLYLPLCARSCLQVFAGAALSEPHFPPPPPAAGPAKASRPSANLRRAGTQHTHTRGLVRARARSWSLHARRGARTPVVLVVVRGSGSVTRPCLAACRRARTASAHVCFCMRVHTCACLHTRVVMLPAMQTRGCAPMRARACAHARWHGYVCTPPWRGSHSRAVLGHPCACTACTNTHALLPGCSSHACARPPQQHVHAHPCVRAQLP